MKAADKMTQNVRSVGPLPMPVTKSEGGKLMTCLTRWWRGLRERTLARTEIAHQNSIASARPRSGGCRSDTRTLAGKWPDPLTITALHLTALQLTSHTGRCAHSSAHVSAADRERSSGSRASALS